MAEKYKGKEIGIMDINDYQRKATSTAVFPHVEITDGDGLHVNAGIVYCSLKLAGEAGEHAEKVAKLYFRGDFVGKDTTKPKLEIVNELGDVLWYIANLADMYGYELSEIAQMNIDKLADRKERGVLKGSGDNR